MKPIDILLKLGELVTEINLKAEYTKKATPDNPMFLMANIYNGDMKLVSRIEATFDYISDNNYLVVRLEKPMDIFGKFLFLDRILQANFSQEAVEIVRSRATLSRRSNEPLYIHFNMELGIITVLPQSEAINLVKGLSDDEIDRTVLIEIKSRAKDNYDTISRQVAPIAKRILHTLDSSY